MNTLAKDVTENMDKYEMGIAVQKVYDFIWDEFCDWYIEITKAHLQQREGSGISKCSILDIKDGTDRGIKAVTSIYAVYHRGNLLHASPGRRHDYARKMAGVQSRMEFAAEEEMVEHCKDL